MTAAQRDARLLADLASLKKLQEASTIFSFEPIGQPPDRYKLTYQGRGIARDNSSRALVTYLDRHQVELRLSYLYPESPPDIRWLTPIFHPNISFSGFIQLAEIGVPWSPAASLDVVCEQLWEVARGAFVNLDKAVNFPAKEWFETQSEVTFPVDPRPLRDSAVPAAHNIVKYERRPGSARPQSAAEVLYIGDDAPAAPLPPPLPRPSARRNDDVLYIGDE
jgi:ubiquitin-protein ligase